MVLLVQLDHPLIVEKEAYLLLWRANFLARLEVYFSRRPTHRYVL